MIYKAFFVTTGTGESDVSRLNAFDKALMDAKIAQGNLVPVSSILPAAAEKLTTIPKIIPGSIMHCVLARKDGVKGEEITSGIGYAFTTDRYGIVMEAIGNHSPRKIRAIVTANLYEMAEARDTTIQKVSYASATIKEIGSKFGSVIAALVYCDE